MDKLKANKIAEASLADCRKLAQGLHARYLVDDLGTGARFVAAVGEAGEGLGHFPSVSLGDGYVDLKLAPPTPSTATKWAPSTSLTG
jgi:4a-hydroxytetrahydrobiopterin dehydratase